MGACNQGMSIKYGIHGKRSWCTTQERRWHDFSIGGYETCAQPINAKCINFLSQVCYVCMIPGDSHRMIQDDQYGIWYAMWRCYGYCLQALCFSLLKSLFSFIFFIWPLLQNAQTKIAIVYMREQSCDTRDDMMIPRWGYQDHMVFMQWKGR